MWQQYSIALKPRSKGFHLVTDEITRQIPELNNYRIGMLHLFIQHTSASLCLNENADPDVRTDLESHMQHIAPDNAPYYLHTCEGPDDMPAHIKHALIGSSLTIPIQNGRLALGTWQGIYLGEHRNHASSRNVIATINGE